MGTTTLRAVDTGEATKTPRTTSGSILRDWMLRDGVKKSRLAACAAPSKRTNAREAHSLMSSWMVEDGVQRAWKEKQVPIGGLSSRAHIVSNARSSTSMMSSWIWNEGISRFFVCRPRAARYASAPLASSWLLSEGIFRLPGYLFVAEKSRLGPGKGSLAYSWLVSSGVSRIIPKSRMSMPILAIAAIGCCATLVASSSTIRKAAEEQRRPAATSLGRHNSTGAVAFLLRKVA
jgi:hypothetical protein